MTDIFFKALYTIQFLCKVAWLPKYTKLIYKTWGTEFFGTDKEYNILC